MNGNLHIQNQFWEGIGQSLGGGMLSIIPNVLIFCANYSGLSPGHPKWWCSRGIPLKVPLIQV